MKYQSEYEEFVSKMAEAALKEGVVNMIDIKVLCKKCYESGYWEGHSAGYSQGVADADH